MKKVGNQGFSLVELIIVVALIVILSGFGIVGLTVLTSRPVDECAKKLQVALEGNRNTTMGKFDSYVEFYVDSSGNVMMKETMKGTTGTPTVREKQIGQSVVTVTYKLKGDDTEHSLGNVSSPLKLSFNRASGSLNQQLDGTTIEEFIVTRGDRKLTVSIEALTGRVDVQ